MRSQAVRRPTNTHNTMPSRSNYRRHAARFKLQVCQDIRSGVLSRSETLKKYKLSNALIQQWMTKFDDGVLDGREDEAPEVNDYEAQIAALERKVGQLTMELDSFRRTSRLRLPGQDGETAPPNRMHPVQDGAE
jgi:transposase-like protein